MLKIRKRIFNFKTKKYNCRMCCQFLLTYYMKYAACFAQVVKKASIYLKINEMTSGKLT